MLHQNPGYSKKSARWVPCLLNDTKESCVKFSHHLLEKFQNSDSHSFQNVVTGDKMWFYDLEHKSQSMGWPEKREPPTTLEWEAVYSVVSTLFEIFFDCGEIVAPVSLDEHAIMMST